MIVVYDDEDDDSETDSDWSLDSLPGTDLVPGGGIVDVGPEAPVGPEPEPEPEPVFGSIGPCKQLRAQLRNVHANIVYMDQLIRGVGLSSNASKMEEIGVKIAAATGLLTLLKEALKRSEAALQEQFDELNCSEMDNNLFDDTGWGL